MTIMQRTLVVFFLVLFTAAAPIAHANVKLYKVTNPHELDFYLQSELKAVTSSDASIYRFVLAPGTYNGNILIGREKPLIDAHNKFVHIEFIGSDRTNTFIVGDELSPTIEVSGPYFLKLGQLTIRGGSDGIRASHAATLDISYSVIENAAGRGLSVSQQSDLKLIRSTVQNNGSDGVVVADNSNLSCDNTIITGNTKKGLIVENNANAVIGATTLTRNQMGALIRSGASANVNNSTFSSNTDYGLQISKSASASVASSIFASNGNGLGAIGTASATLFDNSIEENQQCGIVAAHQAFVTAPRGNRVQFNNQSGSPEFGGVCVRDGGQVMIGETPQTSVNRITSNVGFGITAKHKGSLVLENAEISFNLGDGIDLQYDSSAIFVGGEVKFNSGIGINCMDASGDSKIGGTLPAIISNSGGTTNCSVY